jgi:hypothetical protein
MSSPTTAHPPNEKSRDLSRLFECSDTADWRRWNQLVSAVFGADLMSATSAPLNMARVGMERTNLAAISGFSSILIHDLTLPAIR